MSTTTDDDFLFAGQMAEEAQKTNGSLEERVAEIIPKKLYFCAIRSRPISDSSTLYYFVDDEVHYDSFFSDFGPLNLSVLYRFCQNLYEKLEELVGQQCVVVCCGPADECRVNAAYLVGAFVILYFGMTAEIAYLRVHKAEPNGFIGFRDAAMGPATYRLHLHNVLRSVEKAVKFSWLTFDTFDPEEYEYYEKVENGDLNWIIPNKVLSFCGPHNKSVVENGYPYHAPEVYFDYFRTHNISTIIRLNKRMYDAKRFSDAGFEHVDLFFVDGSVPSDEIVERFINVVDNAKGGVAVHCKAGLGRTGTLIACWLMKEYGVTAAESMAWLRICRPGSVIGPQQEFLIEKQPWCWAMGSKAASAHLSQLASKGSTAHWMMESRTAEERSRIRSSYVLSSTTVIPQDMLFSSNPCRIVNEIRIGDSTSNGTVRPSRPTSLRTTPKRITEVEKVSGKKKGPKPSQGDHLLVQKAKAQHSVPHAKFTSPTTPVKPLSTASGTKARPLLQMQGNGDLSNPPPISRVTVSATTSTATGRPLTKRKSARRLATVRSKPYPCSGVKVHLPPSVYELRPRNNKTYSLLHFKDPAENLSPNSAALIGVTTARRTLNGIMK